MSEFCLECYNKLHNTHYKKRHVILYYDLCEDCGEIKKCIVDFKSKPSEFLIWWKKTTSIKRLIFLICMLAVYTVIMILGFIFVLRSNGESRNNMWEQRYVYIDYSEAEKAVIYERLGLNISKLALSTFKIYREDFLTPADFAKELHVIELAFENIYCSVRILCHADEVGWEREMQTVRYVPIEIIGLQFGYSTNGILRYDNKVNNVIFIFNCSESFESQIYHDFLRLFFILEEN